METLKQAAITAISQLPDTANIYDMQAVFKQLEQTSKPMQNQATGGIENEGISCYELAKDLLGSGEGPEDLSANKSDETETKPVSCYDLAKDYIGCIEGPKDLSTNKDYLKGYSS